MCEIDFDSSDCEGDDRGVLHFDHQGCVVFPGVCFDVERVVVIVVHDTGLSVPRRVRPEFEVSILRIPEFVLGGRAGWTRESRDEHGSMQRSDADQQGPGD